MKQWDASKIPTIAEPAPPVPLTTYDKAFTEWCGRNYLLLNGKWYHRFMSNGKAYTTAELLKEYQFRNEKMEVI